MKVVIVLPTFNESQNLRLLLQNIKKDVKTAQIIIVDDSYPKESNKIKQIASDFQQVEIITRQKKLGRGSAVLDGFKHALRDKEFRYFVEMDTDLAHDPKELNHFYDRIREGKEDLVIGSRYLDASKIVDWPLRRLVMSKIINFFLNFWLGLNLHDYTNGYRMYTRRAVECLVKTGLREKNFIALSESAFLLKKQGMKIAEIPITFTDRKHGISSVGSRELFQSLLGAFRIKLRYFFHV